MIVGCLLARDFDDAAYRLPRERLEEAGVSVRVVGLRRGQVLVGLGGRERVRVDAGIATVHPIELDGIYIPGGSSPDHLRSHPLVIDLVRRIFRAGRPVGALGHGPQVLLTAGLVRGRRMTASPTVRGDLLAAGATVLDREIVVDGNLVTTRSTHPSEIDVFSYVLLSMLGIVTDPFMDDVISVQLSG